MIPSLPTSIPDPLRTNTGSFDAPDRYDDWFDRHAAAYQSELRALRALWPDDGDGLKVGVGTVHFAAPLGIEHGVDPLPKCGNGPASVESR